MICKTPSSEPFARYAGPHCPARRYAPPATAEYDPRSSRRNQRIGRLAPS